MIRELTIRGAAFGAAAAGAGLGVGLVAGAEAATWTVIVLVAAAAILGAGAGLLTFWSSEEAIDAITDAARRLAAGELWERVSVSSPSTTELVREFNRMASHVQELVNATRANEARLKAVFDAATDAMIAIASDTTVQFLNTAAGQVLGVPRENAIGRSLIESARDYELDALVRRVISMPSSPSSAVVIFGRQRTQLRAIAVPIREGGDWAVLLILNDLTEVQRLDQVRRDFLSNVSHELRTPLASIRALVETIEDGGVDERAEASEFLRRIRQQVERMTALVNELLDLSRIESGAIELHPELVSLLDVARECASLLQARCESARITIDVSGAGSDRVEADRPSLLRVVTNLLDNAIKFSPQGATVHVGIADEGELVAVAVRDEGPGIQAQDLSRVFERFYKGEASRATTGAGLGLAIVKHLVRAHGGTAEAANAPAGGAVFTVRIPRRFVGARSTTGR